MKNSSNLEVDKRCIGCDRLDVGIIALCTILLEPQSQWTRLGGCAHRTHNLPTTADNDKGKKPLNPLKHSKRSMGKKA